MLRAAGDAGVQPLAPRLHGAYDLFGNARTVIKGGWARYYHMRSSDDLQIANKNTISQARYRWRDLNGNRDYDPGEVNLDPNGADFIDRTLRGIGSAFGGGIINPDTTQRYQDELLLSVEQQHFRLGGPGHWRPYRRQESMAS